MDFLVDVFFVGILRDPDLEGFKPCLEADDLKKSDLKTSSCGFLPPAR